MRGTRVPVYAVLELIGHGVAFTDIVASYYPDLAVDDVRACVAYAGALVRGEEVHVASGAPWLRLLVDP